MAAPILEIATQSGNYTLVPSPTTYAVRDENAKFVGLVEGRVSKSWAVPMIGRDVTFETCEDAIEALLKHNRDNVL